ncbi:MAG TPA: serine/threonine-protein kinase [Rudaea sp.]|nr:serine/threonine-protein kinase [Rudaea sp.]
MKPDARKDDELEKLAARIADDQPVDWQEAGADDTMAGLREMQQLVQGYRHIQLGMGRNTPRSSRFQFGGLTVVDLIGQGTQGEVWCAYDPMLDLNVALKLRKLGSDTLSHQFLAEARRLARVRQANIVSVYGAAVHRGRAGIWTELIRGTSLAELLKQHGPFPADEVRGIGLDLCHALAAVHRHGLVHGDVKTDNVMREVSGRIVLMDFGAAREFEKAQGPAVSGTLNYLAPEVLRGAAPSPASDIYALGVLLFRILSGAYPYEASDLEALLRAQDRGERARLVSLRKDVPRGLAKAVETALEPDPARRHATALGFAAALAADEPAAQSLWRRIGIAALAAGLAGVVATVGMAWRGSTPGWQTELTFRRVDRNGSVALADGATVALGDRLALDFRTSRPTYFYVFDDDGSGDASVLFPLTGVKPGNPLAADVAHRLPGTAGTTPMTWQISRRAERERIVVIATDTPQPLLERAVADWEHAGGTEVASVARGALALSAAPQETEVASAALRHVLDELDRNAGDAGMRRWQFVFPHGER